jgi:hypothetical protein
MPEISRFLGIVIRMYFFDHDPPHFHAAYSGMNAQIQIDPTTVLRGWLPPRVLALVSEWARLHREELFLNWRRLHAGFPRIRIPPLE